MPDAWTMVYYLPASEHKMLKSTLARPLQQGSYRTASESAFPSFTNFLRGTEYPTLHVGHRSHRRPAERLMSLFNLLIGRPIATTEERAEHSGPVAGIPVFGLDALSSAAYGPEAALTLLIPLGLAGIQHIVPISLAIIGLLAIVFVSYLQTIDAYPHGGGSYTVASENLGANAGLLAAAALMIDYILNAAVGISAGVGALVSAFPRLEPHTLALCLAILLILTLINVRGVKDTGTAFLIPTYLFVGTLLLVIVVGAVRAFAAGGHPAPIVDPPHLPVSASMLSLWLLAKVFAI